VAGTPQPTSGLGVSTTDVPRFKALRFVGPVASLITMLGSTLGGEVAFVVTRLMPVTPVALPEAVIRF
jgi:hypothetical protein